MPQNFRSILHGAIVASVYMTIVSSLSDIGRLLIECGLIARSVLIERKAPSH
jgi:hypothetical protein